MSITRQETAAAGGALRRRLLVATVTSVMAVSTLMQYSLSAVSPFVIEDLRLTNSAYGSLFTVYFIVCSVGSLLLGGATQRIGARWGMALVGIMSCAGLLVMTVKPVLLVMYLGLLFSGIAGAISNPATNLALMNEPNRGPLIGIKQSGVQLSALIGGVIVAPLAQALGWRQTLVICAAACLLLLPAAALVPLRTRPAPGAASRRGGATSILGLGLFAFFMGCGLANAIAYLPVYATDGLALSTTTAGQLLTILGVGAVVGRIGWGYLSEHLPRFGRAHVVLGLLALGGLCAMVMLATGLTPLAYAGATLMGLTGAAWNGLVMSFVIDSVKPEHSGRAAGRVQSAFFAGLCVGPMPFGLIIDQTGSFIQAWAIATVVYIAAITVTQTLLRRRRAQTA